MDFDIFEYLYDYDSDKVSVDAYIQMAGAALESEWLIEDSDAFYDDVKKSLLEKFWDEVVSDKELKEAVNDFIEENELF